MLVSLLDNIIRVCLVGMKSWWTENKGEKSGEKTVEVVVWLGGERERGEGRENWWSPGVFSPGPPKINLPKLGDRKSVV